MYIIMYMYVIHVQSFACVHVYTYTYIVHAPMNVPRTVLIDMYM